MALFLDGKTFANDKLMIALEITLTREKVVLGFGQTATENEAVWTAFLQQLVARGRRWEQGLLCVIDGAKGVRAAIRRGFCSTGLVHRTLHRLGLFPALGVSLKTTNVGSRPAPN